jgi:hypothetical protein
MPSTPDIIALRHSLTPFILSLRDTTLLQLPADLHALHALEILALHAPLGILPLQATNPRTLHPARGQVLASNAIAHYCAFPNLIRSMSHLSISNRFDMTDVYLNLNLCANEASLNLENEATIKPTNLAEARDGAEGLTSGNSFALWTMGAERQHPAEMVGRLAACDRVLRVAEVHDAVARLRGAIEAAANEPTFDVVGTVTEELKFFAQRMESLDQRHDGIMGECDTI